VSRQRLARPALAGALLGLLTAGCDATLNPLRWGRKEDPLTVLASDKAPGDKKARALSQLVEPDVKLAPDRHKLYLEVLSRAATSDPQAYCRMMAIMTLGSWKDPQVVNVLEEAYYKSNAFAPEIATTLRCQTLQALGQTGQPAAVQVLVRVLREPPLDPTKAAEEDKQLSLDVKLAAARALGNFNVRTGTEALIEVLRNEKDDGLRNAAHDSLQASTGKRLPAEVAAWEQWLSDPGPRPTGVAREGERRIILTGGEK
jgi:HEAT repeat protein